MNPFIKPITIFVRPPPRPKPPNKKGDRYYTKKVVKTLSSQLLTSSAVRLPSLWFPRRYQRVVVMVMYISSTICCSHKYDLRITKAIIVIKIITYSINYHVIITTRGMFLCIPGHLLLINYIIFYV